MSAYTIRSMRPNAAAFVKRQAVTDQRIVTANGTGALEFARELLLLLQADAKNRIYLYYSFNKNGFFEEEGAALSGLYYHIPSLQ